MLMKSGVSVARGIVILIMMIVVVSGCSLNQPFQVNCNPPDPLVLPNIDDDGYARFDKEDRERLIEYIIRVEQCLY